METKERDFLKSDLAAMGFEEVPTSTETGLLAGNRDFLRGSTLVRFWGGVTAHQRGWTHIEHAPHPDTEELREVVNDGHGHGVASLTTYLKGRRPL